MELRFYLRMVQRGWWIIALTMIAALALALANSYFTTPQYRTTARFIISPSAMLTNNSDILYGFDTLDRPSMMATYTAILNSIRVFEAAGAAVGLDAETLETYKAKAVALPDSNVIELAVVGSDAQLARQLADTMGEQMLAYAQPLYRHVYQLSVLDVASNPKAPISPLPIRDASLALMLGAVVGIGLAIGRGYLQQGLQNAPRRGERDLTSLAYNWAFFERALGEALRPGEAPELTVGMCHLEGLQQLIEAQPRPVARQVLDTVTQTMRTELRGKDLIGRRDISSFGILLPATAASDATRILEQVRQALAGPLTIGATGDVIQLKPYISVVTCGAGASARVAVSQLAAGLDQARLSGSGMVQVDPACSENFSLEQWGVQ